jgi:galactose mutarotase-like enzyme
MVKLWHKDYSRAELLQRVGRLEQVGGVEAYRLDDGPEQGVRALHLRGGTGLDCVVLPDRCLDISDFTWNGRSLCWHGSPGRVSPALFHQSDTGFASSFFAGMLTTCGLDNFGPGCVDQGERHFQHGLVHNLPASNVAWGHRWQDDTCTLFVTGTVRQTRLFGENLTLTRTYEMELGGDTLRLHDVVRNEGWERTPFQLTYHCNAGFPLLDEGAKVLGDFTSVEPRDAEAEQGLHGWETMHGPQPGFKEQVFSTTLRPDTSAWAAATLWNPTLDGGLGLRLRWDTTTLPWLLIWRQLGQGAYVVGLEPTNCETVTGRADARAAGTLPYLDPGEERQYSLEFTVVTTP